MVTAWLNFALRTQHETVREACNKEYEAAAGSRKICCCYCCGCCCLCKWNGIELGHGQLHWLCTKRKLHCVRVRFVIWNKFQSFLFCFLFVFCFLGLLFRLYWECQVMHKINNVNNVWIWFSYLELGVWENHRLFQRVMHVSVPGCQVKSAEKAF